MNIGFTARRIDDVRNSWFLERWLAASAHTGRDCYASLLATSGREGWAPSPPARRGRRRRTGARLAGRRRPVSVFGRRVERAAPATGEAGGVALAPEPEIPLAERLAASRAAMDRRQARLEAAVAEKAGRRIRLKPLLLIPEPCWRGRYGRFLLHGLSLNPYDPWNVALLPFHPADAGVIEAPLHPGDPGPQETQAANDLLAQLRQDYAEAYEQMDWTADRSEVGAALERAIAQVKGFAADRLTALSEPADSGTAES